MMELKFINFSEDTYKVKSIDNYDTFTDGDYFEYFYTNNILYY
jgi:hypothetical protein